MIEVPALAIKKTVTLPWQGRHLQFEVAQRLFSSQKVDKGSRMLLESLDPTVFPDHGVAADFGCGYGVLGIAWQSVKAAWTTHYVDRDALAVAFSANNAKQLGDISAQFSADVSLSPPPGGYDLVIWNVPGKAGRPVIAGLIDVTIDALAAGGLLAAVVVNPLVDLFIEGIGRDDTSLELVEVGKAHTVVHLRRDSGKVVERDPFAEGLFDRPSQVFTIAQLEWPLIPVIGLPEYDELGHATRLAGTLMCEGVGDTPVQRWLVAEPGAGHLAALASMLWPEAAGTVASRDVLSLRSTLRALADGLPQSLSIAGIEALALDTTVNMAVVALPMQASIEEIVGGIDAIERSVASSALIVLHGRSTEIARAERVLDRRHWWRLKRRNKQRGFAAMLARVCPP